MQYKYKVHVRCDEAEELPDFELIMSQIDAELRHFDLAKLEPNTSGDYVLTLRVPTELVIRRTLEIFGDICAGRISISSPRLVSGLTDGVFFAGDVPEGMPG